MKSNRRFKVAEDSNQTKDRKIELINIYLDARRERKEKVFTIQLWYWHIMWKWFNPKKDEGGRVNLTPVVFRKIYLLKAGWNLVLCDFQVTIFLKISQVAQKIWRISLTVLAIFIDFHQFLVSFLTLRCYK